MTTQTSNQADNVQHEYCLGSADIIISRTCPNMIIRTYNNAFLRASGYTPEELDGKRHNILRHPDMPAEVFDDMRKTIQSGRPWHGVVKNRRKNKSGLGDYYWVDATITPVFENGAIIGYESFRYPATDSQKHSAEKYYKAIREGKARPPNTLQNLKPDTFQRNDVYKSIIVLMMLTVLVMTVGYMSHLTLALILFAGIVSAFYVRKFIALSLIDDTDTKEYQAVKELSLGNFRYKIPTNSIFTEPLELIRAKIANQYANDTESRLNEAILTSMMDNIRGKVIYTDTDFKIVKYSLSSINMASKLSCSVSDIDLLSLLDDSTKIGLKRKLDKQILAVTMGGDKFDLIIAPVSVRGELKGYTFIFYEVKNGD